MNYFAWDSSANLVTSHILQIKLRGQPGDVIPVHNLSSNIQLEIQFKEESPQNESLFAERLFLKPGKMQFHKVDVIEEGTSFLLTLVINETVNVFVKHGTKPSVKDHERNFSIPDLSSCTKVTGKEEYNCSRNPQQLFLSTNVLKKLGVYYLGVLLPEETPSSNHSHRTRRSCFSGIRKKRSCVEAKDPPPPIGEYATSPLPSYDPLSDVNYTITAEELSCRFWSDDEQKWVTDGCKACIISKTHT